MSWITTLVSEAASAKKRLLTYVDGVRKRFDAFKNAHPRFKRVWEVLTHPTSTRLLGLAVSIALAPLTGGFTLAFTVSIALSCAAIFSSTIFMGTQRYLMGKAKVRGKVMESIINARAKIDKLLKEKPHLQAQLADLENQRPELKTLLHPSEHNPTQQTTMRLANVSQSIYYEGIASVVVMNACFGVGSACGFVCACLTGLSGIIGQTQERLQVTQDVHAANDKRRAAVAAAGLPIEMNPEQEREMVTQARALEAALQVASPALSLVDSYDAQKIEQKQQRTHDYPGFLRCIFDVFNPLAKEELHKDGVHQEVHAHVHSVDPSAPTIPTSQLHPARTPEHASPKLGRALLRLRHKSPRARGGSTPAA